MKTKMLKKIVDIKVYICYKRKMKEMELLIIYGRNEN